MTKLPSASPILEYTVVGDDLLAYCPEQNQAFTLNPTASIVLRHCRDGSLRSDAIAALGGGESAPDLLDCTLGSLSERKLIAAPPLPAVSRRDFVDKWGTMAAVLPVIGSAFIPRAANAQSGDSTDPTLITTPDPGGGPID